MLSQLLCCPPPFSPLVSGCQDVVDHHLPLLCPSPSFSFKKPPKISPYPFSKFPKCSLTHLPSTHNPDSSPAHPSPFTPSSRECQQGCPLSLLLK